MIWSYRIFSADVDFVCVPIVYSVFFKGIFLHISLQFLRNLFFPIFAQLRLLYYVRFLRICRNCANLRQSPLIFLKEMLYI